MGAAESSTLAPARSAPEGPELEALQQRYGGAAADEPEVQDDDYDPRKPEFVAPADDYDPRKPEYILQANDEYEDRAVVQLKQQIQRLQAVLAKRRLDPTSNVVRHYERVLCDLQRAVDAATQKRSSIAQLQDGRFVSAWGAYLAERAMSFGNDLKAALADEVVASLLGSNAKISPKLCLKAEAAPRPSPNCPCPLPAVAGDLPASIPEEERAGKEQQTTVQYVLVPGGPVVYQRRIIDTKTLPAKLFCTIMHPPVPAAAIGSSCS